MGEIIMLIAKIIIGIRRIIICTSMNLKTF